MSYMSSIQIIIICLRVKAAIGHPTTSVVMGNNRWQGKGWVYHGVQGNGKGSGDYWYCGAGQGKGFCSTSIPWSHQECIMDKVKELEKRITHLESWQQSARVQQRHFEVRRTELAGSPINSQ